MNEKKKKDWYPYRRAEQLAMGSNWVTVLNSSPPPAPGPGTPLGGTPSQVSGASVRTAASWAEEWKIPPEAVGRLGVLVNDAKAAANAVAEEETRGPVATARCQTACKDMKTAMQNMKRKYFHFDVLKAEGYALLNLKAPDTIPTPSKTPTAQVSIDTFLRGRHELGVELAYLFGDPKDIENKGYRIFYKLTRTSDPLPAAVEELTSFFYTTKRKDVLALPHESSGMNCTMSARVENNNRAGPMGPIITALVP